MWFCTAPTTTRLLKSRCAAVRLSTSPSCTLSMTTRSSPGRALSAWSSLSSIPTSKPPRLPSMKVAVAEGKPVTLKAASTIADGIAVRRAGDRTLPLVQKYVDDIVTVEEEEIANAILLLLEREKTLAEG